MLLLALLCLCALLLAPTARAGTYYWNDPDTGKYSPVYSGGQATNGDGSAEDYAWGYYGWGGGAVGDNPWFNDNDGGPATCSQDVTVKFTWKPAYPGEPPPQQVVVTKTADAGYGDASEGPDEDPWTAHGKADDGLGDAPGDDYYPVGPPFVCREAMGTHYLVQDGGQDVTVSVKLSSSASPDLDADEWFCWAGCSVDISPVTIELYGGIGPTYTKHFLIGQGVGAYLSAPGAPSSPTDTYNWTISGGKPFDNYVAQNDHATYYPLGSLFPLTNETVHCYFAKPETATLTCQANIGGLSVTATRDILLEKPSSQVDVEIGTVIAEPGFVQLMRNEAYAGGGNAVGIQWTGQVLTPSIFSDWSGDPGQWNWTQLITPGRKRLHLGSWEFEQSSTVTPPDTYGLELLDGSYPYGYFWYAADDTPDGNADSPAEILPNNSDYTEVNVHDSFRDYFMYLPPGADSVVVPLKRVKWYWQFNATQSGGPWTLSGADAQWSFDGDFPNHPEWGACIGMDSLYWPSGSGNI